MKKVYRSTRLVLSLLVLCGTTACDPEEKLDVETIDKAEIGPKGYEVTSDIVWRGEHPDIREHENISQKTLVQCGLGHKDLKEVPIFGGYPGPGALEMARRGEAYIGGVATIENVKVDCLTCGYQYDPWIRAWSKRTIDQTKLHEPLPPAILNLPITLRDEEESNANWEQWIQRGEVVRSSIEYWTDASIENVVDGLNTYLESYGQSIKIPQRSTHDRTLDEYQWTKDELNYELRVLWVYGRSQTHITFLEIKRQTEKTFEERNRELREEAERLMQEEREKETSALE